jgi:hypothetical protein
MRLKQNNGMAVAMVLSIGIICLGFGGTGGQGRGEQSRKDAFQVESNCQFHVCCDGLRPRLNQGHDISNTDGEIILSNLPADNTTFA